MVATVVLTAVYALLWLWFRADQKEKLMASPDAPGTVGREAFIKRAMAESAPRLARKLAIGVYAVPLSVLTLLLIIMEYE